jgi:hypothetical protein
MSTKAQIKTRCPVCGKVYKVPVSAGGHRAKCGECDTVFRVPTQKPELAKNPVASSSPPGHPTEDDILNWLNEGLDEDDRPVRPQMREERKTAMQREKNPNHPAGVVSKEPPQPNPPQSRSEANGSSVRTKDVPRRLTLKRVPQMVAERRAG